MSTSVENPDQLVTSNDPDHPANGFRTDRAAPSDIITWKT